MQFDLVSPERSLASFAASEVGIPAADGDMTAMEGHTPTITSLRPGVLRAVSAQGVKSYVVTGGFAEISSTGVSILAERAVALDQMTAAILDSYIADASDASAVATDKDAANKVMADLLALRSLIA